MSRGYAMYSEIWSDQPPLLTGLLRWWFSIVGKSLPAARILILCFSGLLTGSLFLIMKRSSPVWLALLGCVLLVTSAGYLFYSRAVMIGIPAIALAFLAVYFTILFRSNKHFVYLVLAALAFALSLLSKLFTCAYLPVLLYILLKPDHFIRRELIKSFGSVLVWGALCLGFISSIFFYFCPDAGMLWISQLFAPHLKARTQVEFSGIDYFYNAVISKDWTLWLVAGLGVFPALKRFANYNVLPILFLLGAGGFLYFHRPLWPHHYLLLAPAIAWAAALGVHEFISFLVSSEAKKSSFNAILLVVQAGIIFMALCAMPLRLKDIFAALERQPHQIDQQVLAGLQGSDSKSAWLVTDRPIYGFLSGLLVPPELAVSSRKRRLTGFMNAANYSTAVRKYQPLAVLSARHAFLNNGMIANLEVLGYEEKVSRPGILLFMRDSIERSLQSEPSGWAAQANLLWLLSQDLPRYEVSTAPELQRLTNSQEPMVIRINGLIELHELTVSSNKIIIGANSEAELRGAVKLHGSPATPVQAVLIRNLKLSNPQGVGSNEDVISLKYAEQIWIDHNRISDAPDGLLDITHASDYITISWNQFFYTDKSNSHRFAMLIGHADTNALEDFGKLRVTIHHNWWGPNISERMPRIRFGKVHIFNNLFSAKGSRYCISARLGSEARIESNVFLHAINSFDSLEGGLVNAQDNLFLSSPAPIGLNAAVFIPPYEYTPADPQGLARLLKNASGPYFQAPEVKAVK